MFPKRLGTYLLGVLPGLLFEFSVGFGSPSLAREAMSRVQQVYAFQPYVLGIIFAISCLLIGQVFFVSSWFVEMFVGSLCRFTRFAVIGTLASNWLYRLFGRLQGVSPNRNLWIRLLSRAVFWGRGKKIPFEIRPVIKCHRMAATQLLRRRYGIDPSKGPWESVDLEWQVWSLVLGRQTQGIRETFLTMRAFLSCGLAEVVAIYVSPALRNRYFIVMAAVFMATGLFQAFGFARRRCNPIRDSFARLASVLSELEELNIITRARDKSSDTGTGLEISTDDKESD